MTRESRESSPIDFFISRRFAGFAGESSWFNHVRRET